MLDLIAADTLESKRTVTNIASFMRFAADWQAANPNGTLAGFVAYLDAYQAAGGELPTSVELSEDVDGVRLMTLYQAKGLEFPIVFVPNLLEGEWPTKEQSGGLFPRELLREAVPAGDIHTDEERRLLYVAMTRAQDRLILTTHGGPAATKAAVPVHRPDPRWRGRRGAPGRSNGEHGDGPGRSTRTTEVSLAPDHGGGRGHRSTDRRSPARHAAAVGAGAPPRAAPARERAGRAHGGDQHRRSGDAGCAR